MDENEVSNTLAAWCDSMRKAITLSIGAQESVIRQLKIALSSWDAIEGAALKNIPKNLADAKRAGLEQAAVIAEGCPHGECNLHIASDIRAFKNKV